MTGLLSATVYCDAPGCIRGVAWKGMGGIRAARRFAAADGWAVHTFRIIKGVRQKSPMDFCPEHREN